MFVVSPRVVVFVSGRYPATVLGLRLAAAVRTTQQCPHSFLVIGVSDMCVAYAR